MKSNFMLISIIFFMAGFTLSSCREDNNDQIPTIHITSPFEGENFYIPDTISVNASIVNDQILTSLQVGLVNSQFVSVVPIIYLFPGNSSYQLEMELPVTQNELESGDYYVYIRAEDEFNFKNEYQHVRLIQQPKILEKLILVTYKDAANVGISAIDLENNIDHIADIHTDYTASEIDSKHRQIYIAGVNLMDLSAYNFDNDEIEWQRTAFPPLPMHTSNCLFFEENLYTSYSTYFIYGFRYNGNLVFNATVEENKLPSRIIRFEDYLIADLQSKVGGYNYITTYYLKTGVEKQRISTNYKVVDFYDAGNNEVLILANENEQGTIRIFNPEVNSESELNNVTDKIICSAQISESEYFISTPGLNFLYFLNQQEYQEVLPGTNLFIVKFDPVNSEIFAAGLNQVFVISYPDIEIQNAVTISDGILNLHLFYNR